MNRALHPADVVITAYFAIVSVIALAGGASWIFLAVNAAVVAVDWLLASIHRTRESRLFRILHYWYPLVAVLVAFRELMYLIPAVHAFDDRRFDLALAAFDRRWFGDVLGFWRRLAWPPLVDALHICYWSYFVLPIILGIGLWRRAELARFRQVVATLLVAWYLSYLGYFLVPAVGPHHAVDGVRDAAFDGWLVGSAFHRLLITLEGTMADAFPSGHALIGMIVPILAWKHHRTLFWWLLPFAVGLVAATMALRYHYVVDVLASVALVPLALLGAAAVCRAVEGGESRDSAVYSSSPIGSAHMPE